MKAVIMAAGEGSRMRPLSYSRPKVMLPIANRPILEHLLIEISEAGIKEFVFIVGYHDEQVRDYFDHGHKWGVGIEYCTQKKQVGTADALNQAREQLSGNFLVINGDIIAYRQDIARLIESKDTTMAVTQVKDGRELGMVELSGDRVVRIYEKSLKPPSKTANAGIYRFSPQIFEAIARTPKSPRGEYEITDSIQLLIDGGVKVSHQPISQWLDFSYPWDLLAANEKLLGEIKTRHARTCEENAVIKEPVSIGTGTTIRSGAYLVGPLIIGKNCDIGPNCFIRPHTAIGDNCHIGSAVEVKNSIIMKGSKIPHQSYVGDSIIGEGCNLGAGTKIANRRLDGKNITVSEIDTGRRKLGAIIGDGVETGINVSINVGCLIGNGSHIGPGATASGLIAPNTRIF
ncbi:MAG: bifunctional sugar-1-phosphate nucleotidylyltransferase/acetyltransferase [Chloroflexota bacterium]